MPDKQAAELWERQTRGVLPLTVQEALALEAAMVRKTFGPVRIRDDSEQEETTSPMGNVRGLGGSLGPRVDWGLR